MWGELEIMSAQELEEKFSVQEKVRRESEQLKKQQADLFKLTRENTLKLEKIRANFKHLELEAVEQTKQISEVMDVLRTHQTRVQKREELKTKILTLLYEDLKRG